MRRTGTGRCSRAARSPRKPELGPTTETWARFRSARYRDFHVAENTKLGLGALYSVNFVPDALEPSYGGDPGRRDGLCAPHHVELNRKGRPQGRPSKLKAVNQTLEPANQSHAVGHARLAFCRERRRRSRFPPPGTPAPRRPAPCRRTRSSLSSRSSSIARCEVERRIERPMNPSTSWSSPLVELESDARDRAVVPLARVHIDVSETPASRAAEIDREIVRKRNPADKRPAFPPYSTRTSCSLDNAR